MGLVFVIISAVDLAVPVYSGEFHLLIFLRARDTSLYWAAKIFVYLQNINSFMFSIPTCLLVIRWAT